MYSYKRRYLRDSIKRQTITETKNGVIFSVDTTDRYCMVRVQGSTHQVRAFFPQGWFNVPYWAKKGAPVFIHQKGGKRSWFEIESIGHLIPSETSGNVVPDIDDLPDEILDGCAVSQIPNDPQMAVMVRVGEYRVNNTTYSLDPIRMESSLFTLGMGGKMDDVAEISTISAASTEAEFRYDLICVGPDGVIDVVVGTTFTDTSDETVPDVPGSHVELGRVLIYQNMTCIVNADIYRTFSPKEPERLSVTIDDDDLASTETETTITVEVTDQYNSSVIKSGYGWYMTCEIESGNGQVASTEQGSSTSIIGVHCGTSASCKFTYTRLGTTADQSPVLNIKLESEYPVESSHYIILRDSSGDEMTS